MTVVVVTVADVTEGIKMGIMYLSCQTWFVRRIYLASVICGLPRATFSLKRRLRSRLVGGGGLSLVGRDDITARTASASCFSFIARRRLGRIAPGRQARICEALPHRLR